MGHAVDFPKRSVLTLPHAPKEIYANAKIAVDAPVSLHPLQGPGKAIYAIYALCCHNVMLNGIFLNVKKKKKKMAVRSMKSEYFTPSFLLLTLNRAGRPVNDMNSAVNDMNSAVTDMNSAAALCSCPGSLDELRSKTHNRLKDRFLIGRNRTKRAHF